VVAVLIKKAGLHALFDLAYFIFAMKRARHMHARDDAAQRQALDKRPKITSMVFYGGNRFLGIFFHRQDGKARDVFLPKTG